MENRNRPTLDDVLNTFVAENDEPTAENLKEWVERYPQYRRELVDFATVWVEQLVLPLAPKMGPDAEKALIDSAMSHVLNTAYDREQHIHGHADGEDPIPSLTSEAQRAGMNMQEFAEACGLDLALVSKLNSRQFKPESIPSELVDLLGRLLRKSTIAIRVYLRKPTRATTGKAFLALGKPTSMEQQSFADAVQASLLSEKEKARWLGQRTGKEG